MSTDEHSTEMQQALQSLLALAGMQTDSPVTSEDVLTAVNKLRLTILEARMSAAPMVETVPQITPTPASGNSEKTILIAGELGIIIHQLKQSLTRLGAEVSIINDFYEAIRLYQLHAFRVVILDANTPDGLRTLEAVVENARKRQLDTDIIVLIQPSKDNTFQQRCKNLGATVVLPKDEGWQTFIYEYLKTVGF